MNELNHLAIIMDGNGRWAKNRGFLRTKGHENGALVVEKICDFCISNEIKILTLYAFSTENWKRPKTEIDFLLDLLKKFLVSRKENFVKNGIFFNTIGDIDIFNDDLKLEIKNLKNITKDNKKLKFNLAINYGAKDEIIRATKSLISQKKEITEENLNEFLDEKEQIDLLIRTGGEQRLSNFMLWQASYAELAFTDTLWPDFKKEELQKIVDDFRLKNRRFGAI
ncbi:undecaprenyl diphosphate synthetase [Campylobacter pinnipediorum subsp. pinnipediorum]|uniref:Isoprenyl transferase n=1 Tax=Campylobacter pinnipediorum subsp. pinnipediorum TaxID=1660067 RepID=A0AAX0LC74_9BACT|nr:polyprenyl diphosphate synthase [Campylobacter pinnipediorum]AQW81427.1 undecaprenyl diphosphate synthetase [Campylobacter pinnipediorum subsp. pinnipediorum]AQW84623.1 undecaprenyl diphosphate synthetase [Campylobacter pinnipediorum subsp. pinnipediorum]OPA81903.1 di-trans,poly-cis-decaprenylcistransferase [Campylobacter pinnipediorum subsp. pinnipediorum]